MEIINSNTNNQKIFKNPLSVNFWKTFYHTHDVSFENFKLSVSF